jgi:hypothetical protein
MALEKFDFYSRSQPAKPAVALSLRRQAAVLSLRSRRQHKAWGASPRLAFDNQASPRQRVTACRFHAVAPFHGLNRFFLILILGLAPQALCCHLLRRLSARLR